MKHLLNRFSAFIAALVLSVGAMANSENTRILMVVSGYGQQDGDVRPGYEFDEFAKAYLVFKQHGIHVDVASPLGGAVVADKFDRNKPYNAAVLQDSLIMAKLDNTLPTNTVAADAYEGIFVVGGKGAMFDLPNDSALQSVIARLYEAQGSIAAVCHGPAALVNVTLEDGSYLVANKAVNSFTNKEERLFGKKWLPEFEFMLEDKLIERGAVFESSNIMLSHVAVDERLITGQNPSSTVDVALALIKSMGIQPSPVKRFKDDKTLAVVAALLEGNSAAAEQLKMNSESYQIELVGAYGYHYLEVASTDNELRNALMLMQLAREAIDNPRFDLKIAQVQYKLGSKVEAKATLNDILEYNPKFEPAHTMLKKIAL